MSGILSQTEIVGKYQRLLVYYDLTKPNSHTATRYYATPETERQNTYTATIYFDR
jgi:hypothetical protein